MRDLLITHLMTHDAERARFLRHCGVPGALLALSAAGGAAGERRFPLLRDDGDWLGLNDHLPQIVGRADVGDSRALLAGIREAIDSLEPAELSGDEGSQLQDLTRHALRAIRQELDGKAEPIDLSVLTEYTNLSKSLNPLPPLPDLKRTWDALAPDLAVELAEEQVVELKRWFDFIALVEGNEPRLLAQVGFPDNYRARFSDFLDMCDGVLLGVRIITNSDPLEGVTDDEDPATAGDYDQEEEQEADYLREFEDAVAALLALGAPKELQERASQLLTSLEEQRTIREERTETWGERMRPEPDWDEIRGRSEPSERFDVDALFTDL